MTYVPADPLTEAGPGLFEGYWRCRFVDSDGTALPAAAVYEKTDLCIGNNRAARGGPRFGDIFCDFDCENGRLLIELADGRTAAVALQKDGFMRLTLGDEVLYLERCVSDDN